jgi:alpha-galactosidase
VVVVADPDRIGVSSTVAATEGRAVAEWDAADRQLHLTNGRLSYIVRVLEDGSLGHVHAGDALATGRSYRHIVPRPFEGFDNRVGESIAFEVPTPGSGDFRIPALVVEQVDGSTVLELRYQAHRIVPGKPAPTTEAGLVALPATYVEDDAEAATVEIDLADERSGLEVTASYTIFRDVDAVARRLRIRNGGSAAVRLTTAMSASLDLPDAGWSFVHLSGAWGRERHVVSTPLRTGRQAVSSSRGSGGHQVNPFIALVRPTTTEEAGDAFGFSLIYSGNLVAEVEVDPHDTARVRLGIAPETFAWTLPPGAAFDTPEAVLAWSGAGLGALSDTYHRLYRERLARGRWRDRPRPVVLNNWEGTYFDFDEERILAIAAAGRDLGVELFVLDDGWFGQRDNDDSSLGDWFVDRRKLPDGIDGLARKVEALGIRFGLWIEPEMISQRSRLFEEHPDWAIGIPGRHRTESRSQYVLDMSRPEVVDHLFEVLSDVLRDAAVSYVKWDYNRFITEPFSDALPPDRQGEFFHRYILGLYGLYGRLTTAFPDILFESCASGGGRFDPGLLAYAPQAWTSDDTDAIERLKIQWGTSLAYPISSMAAHVSAVPNHQVGRVASLATRAAVAFFGVFGYELDATALSTADRVEVGEQIAFYLRHRDVLQFGRFVRLRSPFEDDGNETAWMSVAPDARRAVVGYYQVLARPVQGPERLRLRGLDPAARYRVSAWPEVDDRITKANLGVRGGDELMTVGLLFDHDRDETAGRGDFWARLFVLEAE